ncbi:alanine racemase [Parasedimentitalea maritima]|uniref:alanine racemase n=1 Tax=Parasedimentitalea maritima TaxID=2578117 RepID=A0ABY2UVZ3_9RHOB|nr:alanine racemase C-terminal domain-containing protein [Zongyanglinia marina]TLP57675.1 alanine racemase [Zongyanglinia marina]
MADAAIESSWCEISVPKIAGNLLSTLKRMPDNTQLCAVVKSDAYGHGIENVVPLLMEQNIGYIGISSNAEARAVRNAGFVGRLLRLRTATPQEIKSALGDRIEEMFGGAAAVRSLIETLGQEALPKLHISLNAGGMSRDGLELSTARGRAGFFEILELVPDQIVGLCTHFPSNEPVELAESIQRFHDDQAWIFSNSDLRRQDILVHAGSTLTLHSGQDPKADMMRCGAILYGIAGPRPDFQSALVLKSRVVSIGDYPKGSTIGYDRSCCLSEDKVLASIALGYANGYSRRFSGGGEVLIRGQRLPVMGKISINTIVADVTSLPAIDVGDEVVAFGQQGDQVISSVAIEDLAGTIMADLFVDWGQRNARVVTQN